MLTDTEAVEDTDYYTTPPTERPAGLPATFVLVEVWQSQGDDFVRFLGWAYLDADIVNELHRQAVAVLCAYSVATIRTRAARHGDGIVRSTAPPGSKNNDSQKD